MKIQLATKPLSEVQTEYLVLPIFEDVKSLYNGTVSDFLNDNPKFGKLFENQLLYSKSKKILLLGAGKKAKFNFETLQNWVGAAVRMLAKKTKQASIMIPQMDDLPSDEMGQAIALGTEIAGHDPTKSYKSELEADKLTNLEVVLVRADRGYQDGLKKGLILAESINLARQLGDMPPNEMTPTYFLNVVRKVAKQNRLKITVIDEKIAKKMGMGAFSGVAQGSDEPSYLIALEYKGNIKSKDKWGIVGKGITFDSGGLSIKPADAMKDMKYDMCGAANTLATVLTVAKLGLKINLVAVMAVTENLPGGKAQRPGDIVKTYSGKTAEIVNTDAEGRLVVIDALAYIQKDLKATKLIDIATLTGAMVVALGDFYTGVFSNDDHLAQEIVQAAHKVGERMWQMPMDEEFSEMISSEIADIENSGHGGSMGHRTAGSITGAKFIEAGVGDGISWAHLDIAGTGWDLKPKPYRGIGATGVGVKTLVSLLSSGGL